MVTSSGSLSFRNEEHLTHVIISCQPRIPFFAIDNCVSADMPREGPNLERRRDIVRQMMTHRHTSRCKHPGPCTYNYPKGGLELTTTSENGKVQHWRQHEEDAGIVPHHPGLLDEFLCHINVEVCWGPASFEYLFKYFWKRRAHVFSQFDLI